MLRIYDSIPAKANTHGKAANGNCFSGFSSRSLTALWSGSHLAPAMQT